MDGTAALGVVHRRRLREIWRSAGWPCQDMVEVELLAAGLLQRQVDTLGRETLRVTDAGIEVLAATLRKNRAARSAHEVLVERIAREMQRSGRLAWCGLSLRAPLPPTAAGGATRWVMAMPDVYSIRHTSLEDQAHPVVHEIKVRRADLVADLRRPDKAAAYQALSSECWYVLKAGIGTAEEIPPCFGVMVAHDGPLEVLRAAPRQARRVSFPVWMALARANACPAEDGSAQGLLGEAPVEGDGQGGSGLGDGHGDRDLNGT